MKRPWSELDIESCLADLITAAFILCPADLIGHTHLPPITSVDREMNSTLRRRVGEIDDYEMACLFAVCVPSDKIQVALVVRPSGPLAQLPLPLFEILSLQGLEQLPIEVLQTAIGRLFRTTPQEDRKPDTPPFELPLMEQDCALQRRYGNGRRLRL